MTNSYLETLFPELDKRKRRMVATMLIEARIEEVNDIFLMLDWNKENQERHLSKRLDLLRGMLKDGK